MEVEAQPIEHGKSKGPKVPLRSEFRARNFPLSALLVRWVGRKASNQHRMSEGARACHGSMFARQLQKEPLPKAGRGPICGSLSCGIGVLLDFTVSEFQKPRISMEERLQDW